MTTNDRHDTTNDPIIPVLPKFGSLAGGRSYLRGESPGRVIHMAGAKNPIVLDPHARSGDPFDASRFLREMANDLLGPGVLDRGGDKLTDTEFDTLNAALDAAAVQTAQRRRTTGIVPVAMLPSVDGAPIYFDPMSTFGDINHTLNTTPEEKP